jgi:DNA-3-methyladenine glycosylase II
VASLLSTSLSQSHEVIELYTLHPIPPFRLDLTAWALRRRPHNTVDRWDRTTYRRVLVIGDEQLETAVVQSGAVEHPRLRVTLNGRTIPRGAQKTAAVLLKRMLGLDVDLSLFYRLTSSDKRLAPVIERFRGLKPPRFPSVFEGLVNGIACQPLSLTVGIWLLNRLSMQCGRSVHLQDSVQHAFPGPEDIPLLDEDTLRSMGFSYTKARYLLAASQSVVGGKLNSERLEGLDDLAAVQQLVSLHGVGRWTAEYVLLRGLGRMNVFPGDDVGARNRLARWLGTDKPMDYDTVRKAVRRWQPYSGLVYFHLLLDGLTRSGTISPDIGSNPAKS